MDVEAVWSLYVPSRQLMQVLAPTESLHLPSAHSRQGEPFAVLLSYGVVGGGEGKGGLVRRLATNFLPSISGEKLNVRKKLTWAVTTRDTIFADFIWCAPTLSSLPSNTAHAESSASNRKLGGFAFSASS